MPDYQILERRKAKGKSKIFYRSTFAILENCFTFALTKDKGERFLTSECEIMRE
jgi:hypothetical protein